MVGPGEVDEELQDEVKGECCETYGPVAKCVIYEVTERVPPEEAVRIFVQFTNPGDATKGKVEAGRVLCILTPAGLDVVSTDKTHLSFDRFTWTIFWRSQSQSCVL